MTTVDQFLKALALTESDDNPEAWGDAGRAMGRWQVHPDALWTHAEKYGISPKLGETWDQVVSRVLRALYANRTTLELDDEVAMYWHLGHPSTPASRDWDHRYAGRFAWALARAIAEVP